MCWLLLLVYVASSIRSLVRLVPAYSIDRYIAPWYYVNYTDGFVRRGLPGEVLRLVWTQSKVPVEVAGWGVSFIGVLAVLFIGYRIVLLASDTTARVVTATLLVIAPLGLTTIIRDPGRYEDIGMMAMAVMVLVAARRSSAAVTVTVAAVTTAIAVASEELVLPYIAPVVLALLFMNVDICPREREQGPRLGKRCAGLLSLAFVPGVALALASVTIQPSAAYLADLQVRSNPRAAYNAVWALGHQSVSTFMDVVWRSRAPSLPEDTAIWLAVYLATIVAVRVVIGPLGRWYWPSAAYSALVTFVILFSGIDIRRWWTISLVAHFSVVAILWSRDRVPRETRGWGKRVALFTVLGALAVSLYGQSLPNTVRPDGYFGGSYLDLLRPFWIEGDEPP